MFRRLLFIVSGLLATLAALLLVLAWFGEPPPTLATALQTLSTRERTALEALAGAGRFAPQSLRSLGGYYDGLLDTPLNERAVWIDEGHVRALRIAHWPVAEPPDLSAFSELRVLWLDTGALERLPDLSALTQLTELQLRDQHVAQLDPARLPPGVVTLGLARNPLTAIDALASRPTLRSIDLARTRVTDIAALVPLPIDRIDLSGTPLAALPDAVPATRHGDWSMNLDDTPFLSPPGLSWQGPGGYAFVGTAFGHETREGYLGSGRVDARGTGDMVPALRPVQLNTLNAQGVYDVTVEASIDRGRIRIWLHPPDHYWRQRSPWFARADIDGFGFLPRQAWVFADIAAGQTATLDGRLWREGSPDRPVMTFEVQPLGPEPAYGFRYRVRNRARPAT